MARWFLDTEFNEDGRTIELISIALVSSDCMRRYYAVSSEFNPDACNDFVKQHVLPNLGNTQPKTRKQIAADVLALLRDDKSKPEIWGYFADYDWVVFCQLFGRMVDLPDGFPMYCLDLKQLMHMLGVKKDQLPQQVDADKHNALNDAEWIQLATKVLQTRMETVKC